jgi:hypothetical protein
MRSFSKLQGCVAAATLMFLYFFFYQRSMGFESAMHKYSISTTLRIVVFGDDWSDTGSYRTVPPPYWGLLLGMLLVATYGLRRSAKE